MPSINPTETSKPSANHSNQAKVDSNQFTVKFWGVRGGIPTPGKDTVRYGGNTACVELNVGGKRLIFDAGTGLRALGKNLLSQMPVEAHLFFTHTHWDRIQGFPFFVPAFIPNNHFHIYGATGLNGASIKQRLTDQMLRPNFPVTLQMMQSNLTFHNIAPGEVITLDDIVIETISLNRPNSALGYRINWNGHSVVYATDTEHSPKRIEQSLGYLAHQADVLIFDAIYADCAYYSLEAASGVWQPETWLASIEVAIAAEVKQIIVFHHDPTHEDDVLDKVESEVQSHFPTVRLAREGMTLQIYKD
jgi:phosphoribosyl 1,2-cyclic phosphodiesterase